MILLSIQCYIRFFTPSHISPQSFLTISNVRALGNRLEQARVHRPSLLSWGSKASRYTALLEVLGRGRRRACRYGPAMEGRQHLYRLMECSIMSIWSVGPCRIRCHARCCVSFVVLSHSGQGEVLTTNMDVLKRGSRDIDRDPVRLDRCGLQSHGIVTWKRKPRVCGSRVEQAVTFD